jgi:hypothetical protein
MSVVSAADILGYEVPESVLVRWMLLNIHPSVSSRLVFASEPKSIKDLYSLASQVAEGRAIDDQRKEIEHRAPSGNRLSDRSDCRHVSMAVGETRRSGSCVLKCRKCSGSGHVSRDCPSPVTSGNRNRGKRRRLPAVKRLAEVRAPQIEQPRCRICPVRVAGVSPWVLLTIGDYGLPAIFDSGSSFSLIKRDVYQQILRLGLPCRVETANRTLHMASGQSCVIKEAVSLQIKLHLFSWRYSFLVLEESPIPSILGVDFLSSVKMQIDFANSCYTFAFQKSCRYDFEAFDPYVLQSCRFPCSEEALVEMIGYTSSLRNRTLPCRKVLGRMTPGTILSRVSAVCMTYTHILN